MSNLKSTKAYKAFRKFGKNLRKTVKRFFFRRKLSKATPVFIFQMGKVASSSIYSSLHHQYPGAVGHAHHIGSDNWHSEELYNWAKNGNSLKIISPIREPIGRNISAFFQCFDMITGELFDPSKYTTDELFDLFIKKQDHDVPLNWFDDNIKKYFNIDVYSTDFPDNGTATYSSGNVSLLILRIDIDDSEKERTINEFLNIDNFRLKNRNLSEGKEYNHAYKTLKQQLKLPDSYLKKMTNSKFFRHFYPEKEINKITEKFR
ncbi:MAG: putative capsular polysaccharide synthesis family protein [Gammaproteobacteria bacterium]|nr:putative capsular polysaccharide synthesis family protein [Gammaproteobacteria bacterium]